MGWTMDIKESKTQEQCLETNVCRECADVLTEFACKKFEWTKDNYEDHPQVLSSFLIPHVNQGFKAWVQSIAFVADGDRKVVILPRCNPESLSITPETSAEAIVNAYVPHLIGGFLKRQKPLSARRAQKLLDGTGVDAGEECLLHFISSIWLTPQHVAILRKDVGNDVYTIPEFLDSDIVASYEAYQMTVFTHSAGPWFYVWNGSSLSENELSMDYGELAWFVSLCRAIKDRG